MVVLELHEDSGLPWTLQLRLGLCSHAEKISCVSHMGVARAACLVELPASVFTQRFQQHVPRAAATVFTDHYQRFVNESRQ